jgi:hypothetical protein
LLIIAISGSQASLIKKDRNPLPSSLKPALNKKMILESRQTPGRSQIRRDLVKELLQTLKYPQWMRFCLSLIHLFTGQTENL